MYLSWTMSSLLEKKYKNVYLIAVSMDKGQNYEVKNIGLAQQGRLNLAWAESQMGALMTIRKRFEHEKPFRGLRIGMALHVTKETGALVRTLILGGAQVAITG